MAESTAEGEEGDSLRFEKASQAARRILEETGITEVKIEWLKAKQYRLALGNYLPEKDFVGVLTIKTEEEIRYIGCYRDTGIVLE